MSTRALTTGSGSAGMDFSDQASDSARTLVGRSGLGGQDHGVRRDAFIRSPESREELEMVTWGKHDRSFEFTEPGVHRRDLPNSQLTSGGNAMNSHGVIRVLSVDDHYLFQQGVASVIDEQTDMRLVARASSGPESIRLYRNHMPDVTLMELRLPGLSGIDSLIAIREEFPKARVIILTTFDGDSEVQRALRAGASGYFLKSVVPKDLLAAIRQVHAGGKRIQTEVLTQIAEHMGEEDLTAREIEVLRLVVTGHRNREIGGQLYISEETVKVHLRHIREKLGARDRTHAVTLAERRGIIRLDSESACMTAALGRATQPRGSSTLKACELISRSRPNRTLSWRRERANHPARPDAPTRVLQA